MQTRTVQHKISLKFQVIEYQLVENDKVVKVYFKVSDYDGNEYDEKYETLSAAIEYISNITFS